MAHKKHSIIALILFGMISNANAEGLFKKIFGRKESPQSPSGIEKRSPAPTDLGTQRSSGRTSLAIPVTSREAERKDLVQQKAYRLEDQRKLKAAERARINQTLDLPDFFGVDGTPNIPTVSTDDGTHLTESFFTGLATHTITEDVTVKGFRLSDLIGENPNLSTIQSVAHTGLVSYLAEHPAFGGNPNRGARPSFFPSYAKMVLETYPNMLPSGELLYPNDHALQYVISGTMHEQRAGIKFNNQIRFKSAHVALTDRDGNILGPNLYPLYNEDAVEDAEGEIVFTSDKWQEIVNYSKGLEFFANSNTLFMEPIPDFSAAFNEFHDRQTAETEMRKLTPLSECYKLMLKLKFKMARECFGDRKEQLMYRELMEAEDYSSLADYRDAAIRGALAGGIVTEITGGMDMGSGIGLGALAGALRVAYNRHLGSDDQITEEQMNALMSFINTYTFAPGADGIILPKTGQWMAYENTILIRYNESAVLRETRTRDVNTGKITRKLTPDIAMTPIDLYGKKRTRNVGYRLKTSENDRATVGEARAYGHYVEMERAAKRGQGLKRQIETYGPVQQGGKESEDPQPPEFPEEARSQDSQSGAQKRTLPKVSNGIFPKPQPPPVVVTGNAATPKVKSNSDGGMRAQQPNPLIPALVHEDASSNEYSNLPIPPVPTPQE